MNQPKSAQGFTLVEVMVSIGVVAIILMGLAEIVSMTRSRQAKIMRTVSTRLAAARVMSDIFSYPGSFPNVSHQGRPGVYVFCFDRKGVSVPTTVQGSNAALTTSALLFMIEYNAASNVCDENASFEARVRTADVGENVIIDIIDISNEDLRSGNFSLLSTRTITRARFL